MLSAKKQKIRRFKNRATFIGVVIKLAQRLSNLPKLGRGNFRDVARIVVRVQRLWVEKYVSQQLDEMGRVVAQVLQCETDHSRFGVGEIRVDLEAVHVAHDEQRRIAQPLAVTEQLLIGRRQIFLLAPCIPSRNTPPCERRPVPSVPSGRLTPFSNA